VDNSGNIDKDQGDYAINLADGSYQWYRTAAIRSRRNHRVWSVASLVFAAAIPVAAAISPKNAIVPAILGAIIVIVTGLRALFHWEENYLRFSGAREAVEAERRLYHTGASPYDHPETKDQTLAAKITSIEQQEMAGWIKVAADQPK
jgi:uncharacterized protein DUF4231